MLNPDQLKSLETMVTRLLEVDRVALVRTKLDDDSLPETFLDTLDELNKRLNVVSRNISRIDDRTGQEIISAIDNILNGVTHQIGLQTSDYITQKHQFLSEFNKNYNIFLTQFYPFLALNIESLDLQELKDVKSSMAIAYKDIESEMIKAVKASEETAAAIIEGAEKKAKEIDLRARSTAEEASLEAAQEQFKEAQEYHGLRAYVWGFISLVLFAAIIAFAWFFILKSKPEMEFKWEILYFVSIRITILAIIASALAFSLKILRAHMHMKVHNLHRQRLSNCMSSFIDSAVTDEQRDMILSRLVDAIADFGSSGLLHVKSTDSAQAPNLVIDNIVKTLASPDKL